MTSLNPTDHPAGTRVLIFSFNTFGTIASIAEAVVSEWSPNGKAVLLDYRDAPSQWSLEMPEVFDVLAPYDVPMMTPGRTEMQEPIYTMDGSRVLQIIDD